jgi:hypothetical protein
VLHPQQRTIRPTHEFGAGPTPVRSAGPEI